MRRSLFNSRFLLILALILLAAFWTALCAAADNGSITGRVLDASTNKPVAGTVVVALESQPGNGAIVNATSPDGNGHFAFTNVKEGNYAIVISASDAGNRGYLPVVVVGKGVTPGANVGTIALKASPKSDAKIAVPVESNKPITVTLAVNQKVGQYSFAIPWADGTPTFDTAANGKCSGGAACTTYHVQIPSAGLRMANFDGKSIQYLPKTLPTSYSVMATAYTQNGAKPTCDSHSSAPLELNPQTANPQPIVFKGCD
jgi:hypothetical protein